MNTETRSHRVFIIKSVFKKIEIAFYICVIEKKAVILYPWKK